MKGDKATIKVLNKTLRSELTAINQFFLHARIYKNWGLDQLNGFSYKASIQAMKNADALIERILFLESLPNLQDTGKLHIGEDPAEMLEADLTLITHRRALLTEAIAHCEIEKDFISRELLVSILDDTETHFDWLETQLSLIQRIGLQNYLQKMMQGAYP